MNNISSKWFSVLISTILFISILFSQDWFPDRVTDPVSIKDQFHPRFPEERFHPERPFSGPDFQNDLRPWLEKGGQIENDYGRQFEPKRPSPTSMYNKQLLDSVWVNSLKASFTYDANGDMTEDLRQWWENNAWVNSLKWTYTYDANGKRTEWLTQNWGNSTWVNIFKRNYTYDANGNVTERLSQGWGVPLAIAYDNTLPKTFSLSQNYPNPFNPVTMIRYELPRFSHVNLTVYDILGQEIAQLIHIDQGPGTKQVQWNASTVPSGIYFVQMQAGDFRQVRKVMVLK